MSTHVSSTLLANPNSVLQFDDALLLLEHISSLRALLNREYLYLALLLIQILLIMLLEYIVLKTLPFFLSQSFKKTLIDRVLEIFFILGHLLVNFRSLLLH